MKLSVNYKFKDQFCCMITFSPCCVISSPTVSSSFVTPNGDIRSVIFKISNDPKKENVTTIASPARCATNNFVSPYNKPLPVVFAGFTAVCANIPVISIPEMAPTP